MHFFTVSTIIVLVFSLFMAFHFVKRANKPGCLSFFTTIVLMLVLNICLLFSLLIVYSSAKEMSQITLLNKKYTATVISYTSDAEDDSSGNFNVVYKPLVQFKTSTGNIIEKELSFQKSRIKIGDTYTVYYDVKNDEELKFPIGLIATTIGNLLFCSLLIFIFIGVLKYALGYRMKGYYSKVKRKELAFKIIVPALLIGFNLMLIYGIFFGNPVPRFITAILVFFVIGLALGTWGYFRMISVKGMPKMEKVGPNKWVSKWDNDDDILDDKEENLIL
ncbi:hypothetical protein M4I21_13415 [Cellulophaga sp. 20_2_10]|uniref:hypothetical protein n=1 Tax=Cellulophaga sp. 20_2_10 TaxID=2942476 RepID=UPI00201A5C52|nr:hypothetical protein [Cellulophaga sp. 20_2_10]MCL5246818.1 hypothetical protein [Cellulophaga sp. 20_2_10]